MKFFIELTQRIIDEILSEEFEIHLAQVADANIYYFDDEIEVMLDKTHAFHIDALMDDGSGRSKNVKAYLDYTRVVTDKPTEDTLNIKATTKNSALEFKSAIVGQIVEVEIL